MAENQNGKKEREPFKINFSERPSLDYVGKIAYLSSIELGGLINQVFKSAFVDFEGCSFDTTNGVPTYSLVFNHGSYGDDQITGITRSSKDITGNDTINRIRARDRSLRDGDKYFATQELKDIVTKLLTNQAYNQGKPNWGTIMAEFNEQTTQNMYMPQQQPQLTKVRFIDINRIVKYIYGGENTEYIVSIAAPIMPFGMQQFQNSKNYMLTITAVDAENIQKVYEKLGFGSLGSGIIR